MIYGNIENTFNYTVIPNPLLADDIPQHLINSKEHAYCLWVEVPTTMILICLKIFIFSNSMKKMISISVTM